MIFKVRKLVGLALAITRGWLPEWYLDVAIKAHGGDCICDIPSVPKEGLSLSECRWEERRIDKERKFNPGDKKKREIVGKMKFDVTIIDMKLTTIKHLLLPWGHIDRISFILEMRVLGHGGRYGKKWFILDMVKNRMFLTFEYFISLKHAVGHYDI